MAAAPGAATHLLLSALVAGSLDAGLALLVAVGVVIVVVMVHEAARTALEAGEAGTSLALEGTAAVPRADWTCRTHRRRACRGHDRLALHTAQHSTAQHKLVGCCDGQQSGAEVDQEPEGKVARRPIAKLNC